MKIPSYKSNLWLGKKQPVQQDEGSWKTIFTTIFKNCFLHSFNTEISILVPLFGSSGKLSSGLHYLNVLEKQEVGHIHCKLNNLKINRTLHACIFLQELDLGALCASPLAEKW
jgi:hypothetical protein